MKLATIHLNEHDVETLLWCLAIAKGILRDPNSKHPVATLEHSIAIQAATQGVIERPSLTTPSEHELAILRFVRDPETYGVRVG